MSDVVDPLLYPLWYHFVKKQRESKKNIIPHFFICIIFILLYTIPLLRNLLDFSPVLM